MAKYIDRDLSWLSFNERIIQEAEDKKTPLMERLKFAAIYSSNLEEFYKVRVAGHRFQLKFRDDSKNKFGYRSSYLLQKINLIVTEQQERLGRVLYDDIIPSLKAEGIHLISQKITRTEKSQIQAYFDKEIANHYTLKEITNKPSIELKNQTVYLYIILEERSFLLELDYKKFGRFITLSKTRNTYKIIQLDDIIKENLAKIVDKKAQAYAIKVSRDAELYLEDEEDEDITKKIINSIKKRETGMPSRLLFDQNISFKEINTFRKKAGLNMGDLLPGGTHHNLYDFFSFPKIENKPHLYPHPQNKIPCKRFDSAEDWFQEIKKEDVFLSFPYQNYSYVTQLLYKAAEDPDVKSIQITLYRVAEDSEICKALEQALINGKNVFVLSEVRARFDEESNIYWGKRLKEAGAKILYGVQNLKVHAKAFLIKRKEGKKIESYCYLGTGNFNEKTAEIYCDHAILTTNKKYANDLEEVFKYIENTSYKPKIKTLLVAPFTLRKKISNFIKRETKHGKDGRMTIKLNSLEDIKTIDLLRKAADKGVKIDLLVRGICCYFPLNKKQAQNITVTSIVDRYLEHTRIYHFHNNGKPVTYLSSADWMTRNLSRRIEIAFPILSKSIQNLLVKEMELQLNDSIKGRVVATENENQFLPGRKAKSSQQQFFSWVEKFENNNI